MVDGGGRGGGGSRLERDNGRSKSLIGESLAFGAYNGSSFL